MLFWLPAGSNEIYSNDPRARAEAARRAETQSSRPAAGAEAGPMSFRDKQRFFAASIGEPDPTNATFGAEWLMPINLLVSSFRVLRLKHIELHIFSL